jgi:formylglycine-generating enzyme required for sulfatase activity
MGGGARAIVPLVLALLALGAADATVWAQGASRTISVENMRSEKRVALVVGNAGYAAPANLKNPLNDAQDIAQALRALGFDVILQTDVDLRAMQRGVREFGARLRPDGIALFYYAGHGVQVRGNNYLVPLGARIGGETEVEDEALDANRVLRVMEESRSRVNVVVLDACRDNPYSRGFRSATRGLATMPAPSGSVVAYATGPGAVAADGTGRNGLFTGELLRAIRTPGLDVVDVFRQVTGSVRERTSGRQVPWTLSSLDGYFYFSLPAGSSGAGLQAKVPPPSEPPRIQGREEMRQEFGTLALSARLPGVEVWLGEQKVWTSRAGAAYVLSNVPTGTHRVVAKKDGHKEWTREVVVAANQRAELVIDIEPLRPTPPPVARSEDGAEMVLVPAGEFTMGSNEDVDEKPPHRVYLAAFHIDKYETTNALYRRFMTATNRVAPAHWSDEKWNGATQPVVGVSWHDAEAYCRWAGKRLPTEAEWEKAARGTDSRKYPWGEQWDASRANSGQSMLGKTAPVGSYPSGVSPYGAHDMAGNAWEWVADWYDKDYYQRSPDRNPKGPESGQSRVLRGGSWHSAPFRLRASDRSNVTPDLRRNGFGFRCARGAS